MEWRATICVKSTDNNYYGLVYQGTTGADYNTGNGGVIRVGGTAQDFTNGEWVRMERDLQADLTARFGKTLSCVTGIYLWSGGTTTPKMWIDDLSFSNSLTVEHNTLGGGVIGHILRNRSTNASTYAATDRWFHYDQVGSVMSESDATGALAQIHCQDAFGNSQASWSTGLWGGDKPGWHHNTKEYDGDIGLVYMYQRWYNLEIGAFGSRAPYPPMIEHPFGFVVAQPVSSIDPLSLLGLTDVLDGPKSRNPLAIRNWGLKVLGPWIAANEPANTRNAMRHCLLSCLITYYCGIDVAATLGLGHELEDYDYDDDQLADFVNNQIGRRFGLDACSPVDCYRKCRQAARGGPLVIDPETPPGVPPPPIGIGL
jgi:hypothetical protein